MKQENIVLQGLVEQELGNSMFRVKLDNLEAAPIICTICGKIRKNYIRVLAGDRVEVEVSPYDLTKGRITRRFKKAEEVNPSINLTKQKKKK